MLARRSTLWRRVRNKILSDIEQLVRRAASLQHRGASVSGRRLQHRFRQVGPEPSGGTHQKRRPGRTAGADAVVDVWHEEHGDLMRKYQRENWGQQPQEGMAHNGSTAAGRRPSQHGGARGGTMHLQYRYV